MTSCRLYETRRGCKLKKFDAVDFLDTDEALIEYLNAALEERDPAFFAKAVGDVARAKGMTAVADATGLGRPSPSIVRSPATATRDSIRCSASWKRWTFGSPSLGSRAVRERSLRRGGDTVAKSYRTLHEQVVARPGAPERLAALRAETLAEIGLHDIRRPTRPLSRRTTRPRARRG